MNWVEAFGAFRSRFRKLFEINGWMLVDVRFKRSRIACVCVYLYSLNSFEQVPTLPGILHVHHAGVLLHAVFSKLPLCGPLPPHNRCDYMGGPRGFYGGCRVFISIWVMGRFYMWSISRVATFARFRRNPRVGGPVRTVS